MNEVYSIFNKKCQIVRSLATYNALGEKVDIGTPTTIYTLNCVYKPMLNYATVGGTAQSSNSYALKVHLPSVYNGTAVSILETDKIYINNEKYEITMMMKLDNNIYELVVSK